LNTANKTLEACAEFQPPGALPLSTTTCWVRRAHCHLTLTTTSGQRDPNSLLCTI